MNPIVHIIHTESRMTALAITADKFGLPSLAGWFKRLSEKLEHSRQVRSTIKELNRLTDRELNDIGLARGDIWSVANHDTTLERVRRTEENANLKGWV